MGRRRSHAPGRGRDKVEDAIDPAVGVIVKAVPGEQVKAGDPLAEVHYRDPDRLDRARKLLDEAWTIGDAIPDPMPLILGSRGDQSRTDIPVRPDQDAKELASKLAKYRESLVANGIIWVSWPKKAAKVPTDVTEDVVRELALPLGLVDTKVCAVDDVWSGLKLVIRLTERAG